MKVEKIIDKHDQALSGRRNWESYWQTLKDYFYIEASDINSSYAPGAELSVTDLWDSTTLEAADILASGFMNYLTPPTSRWFRLRHKDPKIAENKAVNNFLEEVGEEVEHTLNKSNFYHQIISTYKSTGVYGTGCLMEEEDEEENARFYNLPLNQVCIVEDARGRIAEYYLDFEYSAFQAASRWGRDNLHPDLLKDLETRDDKKYKFLLYIGKRSVRDLTKTDKGNMPIEAIWIDRDHKKIMEEGGYNEFPAMTHRFDKRPNVVWGFSPAMKTLPFARMLNAISKTNLRAMMKRTDPPIALPENAFIMPFNANPRAVNFYKKGDMDTSKDIFAFANYGDTNVGMGAVEYYTNKVRSLMYNDVFLAFENITKQMNNPEVMERINEKMTLLGPAVGRFMGEVLNPIIIRTIGILFRRGSLPEPPPELIDDPTYEIDYVSQLAQAQKRSQLNSLVTALTMTGQIAQFAPESLDKVDTDKTVDEVWSITGAPVRVLRDDMEIEKLRQARAEQQQQIEQMTMLKEGAGIAKDAAKAEQDMSRSKEIFE
jgi:hypothetical protein